MSEGHALLSASGSHRWATCAASLRHESTFPDSSSKYADEGSAAHELGSWCLSNGKMPIEYPEKTIHFGDVDWPVAPMVEPITQYVNLVRDYAIGGNLLVEQRVDYSDWLGQPDCYGTSDSVILFEERIVIVDLKYGMGVKVDAEDNEQLMLYALGALYEYAMIGDFREVTVVICQPRIGHVSEWTVPVTDLKIFALNMRAAALKALKVLNASDAPAADAYTPSDGACRFCKGKATCPALRAEVEHETRDLFADMVAVAEGDAGTEIAVIPAEIEPDRLATAMSLVDRIEGWCKAVRAEAERRLLVGQPVPGFKLVQGRRGPRAWTSAEEAEAALKGFRLKSDEMYDKVVISPTTAEKLLKSTPKRWEKLQGLITQSDGKPSVAPVADKRPAVSLSSVNEEFAALAGAEDLV